MPGPWPGPQEGLVEGVRGAGRIAQAALDAVGEHEEVDHFVGLLHVLPVEVQVHVVPDYVGEDGAVLVEEYGEVRDQVPGHRHVVHRADDHLVLVQFLDLSLAGKHLLPVDHHSAGAAYGHPAGVPDGEGGVKLLPDVEEGVQDGGPLEDRHLVVGIPDAQALGRVVPEHLELHLLDGLPQALHDLGVEVERHHGHVSAFLGHQWSTSRKISIVRVPQRNVAAPPRNIIQLTAVS